MRPRVTSLRRLLLVAACAAAALPLSAAPAAAHPLGNFTTNTSANLRVHPDGVDVDYVVDLAEIPALQVIQGLPRAGDGKPDPAAAAGYGADECATIAEQLKLSVAGSKAPLRVESSEVTFPAGQAGLSTLRLVCRLGADASLRAATPVTLDDGAFPDRTGWREVTAVGDGMRLDASDVPETSPTAVLTSYPEGQLQAPLSQRSAALEVSPGSGAAAGGRSALTAPAAAAVDRLSERFTGLVSTERLTLPFALLALVVAIGLGGMHAVAPGHGKTVIAAYLVSRQGTTRQALGLGLTVAICHTAGVLGLGLVLTLTDVATPERIYPWLGLASGLLFAVVGALLLRQALRRSRPRHPATDHADAAAAHGHSHVHAHGHSHGLDAVEDPSAITWRSLVAPGLAGGMVPSPSALVVLLGGIALGRAWFGVALVVAYGVGMGATLVGAGYLLVRARARLLPTGEQGASGRLLRISAALPVVTATLIVAGGLVVAARAVVEIA